MQEEIDLTTKIHLRYWNYGDDWGCEAKVVYTDASNQSITLEYDTEYQSQAIEDINKDLGECLYDPKPWWSEKIFKSNDLVLKIREAEKQIKYYQREVRKHKERIECCERDAARYEKKLNKLQDQAKGKNNE